MTSFGCVMKVVMMKLVMMKLVMMKLVMIKPEMVKLEIVKLEMAKLKMVKLVMIKLQKDCDEVAKCVTLVPGYCYDKAGDEVEDDEAGRVENVNVVREGGRVRGERLKRRIRDPRV